MQFGLTRRHTYKATKLKKENMQQANLITGRLKPQHQIDELLT